MLRLTSLMSISTFEVQFVFKRTYVVWQDEKSMIEKWLLKQG